jgi:hypothetical protein
MAAGRSRNMEKRWLIPWAKREGALKTKQRVLRLHTHKKHLEGTMSI